MREAELELAAPPKFPTECFLLTAHCSYVCWTSLIRRHRSIVREIRYFQSIVASMQAEGATEPVRWVDHVTTVDCHVTCHVTCRVTFYLQKLKKYKDRLEFIQKAHRNVLALILDPELLQQSMQFYCSLSEWMTLQITAGANHRWAWQVGTV